MLPCNVTIGAWQDFQGFRCSSKCVPVFQWCQPEHVGYWPDDVGSSCPELEGLSTRDSQVCHKPKFWLAVHCGQSRAQQCTASYSGQCTGKVTHMDGYTWTLAKCQDKRDLTRHSDGKQCKENEFTCVKEGKVQCLDNQLRCDEMLACDKGEDEEIVKRRTREESKSTTNPDTPACHPSSMAKTIRHLQQYFEKSPTTSRSAIWVVTKLAVKFQQKIGSELVRIKKETT